MSYLQSYEHSSKRRHSLNEVSPAAVAINLSPTRDYSPPRKVDKTKAEKLREIKLASFKNRQLEFDAAQELIYCMETAQAIDFSENQINTFPHIISSHLLALNLANNNIEKPIVMNSVIHLKELNLSQNGISSMKGLSALITLEYLDVSNNLLYDIEGLESMEQLLVLKLQCNHIASYIQLRQLSYNKNLKEIYLDGNPIALDENIRLRMANCIPSLRRLNGSQIRSRTAIRNCNVDDGFKYSELRLDKLASSEAMEFVPIDVDGGIGGGGLSRVSTLDSADNSVNDSMEQHAQMVQSNILPPRKPSNRELYSGRPKNVNSHLKAGGSPSKIRLEAAPPDTIKSDTLWNGKKFSFDVGSASKFVSANHGQLKETMHQSENPFSKILTAGDNSADLDNSNEFTYGVILPPKDMIEEPLNPDHSAASSSNANTELGRKVGKNPLPWRNPPKVQPRPFKGKQLISMEGYEDSHLKSGVSILYDVQNKPEVNNTTLSSIVAKGLYEPPSQPSGPHDDNREASNNNAFRPSSPQRGNEIEKEKPLPSGGIVKSLAQTPGAKDGLMSMKDYANRMLGINNTSRSGIERSISPSATNTRVGTSFHNGKFVSTVAHPGAEPPQFISLAHRTAQRKQQDAMAYMDTMNIQKRKEEEEEEQSRLTEPSLLCPSALMDPSLSDLAAATMYEGNDRGVYYEQKHGNIRANENLPIYRSNEIATSKQPSALEIAAKLAAAAPIKPDSSMVTRSDFQSYEVQYEYQQINPMPELYFKRADERKEFVREAAAEQELQLYKYSDLYDDQRPVTPISSMHRSIAPTEATGPAMVIGEIAPSTKSSEIRDKYVAEKIQKRKEDEEREELLMRMRKHRLDNETKSEPEYVKKVNSFIMKDGSYRSPHRVPSSSDSSVGRVPSRSNSKERPRSAYSYPENRSSPSRFDNIQSQPHYTDLQHFRKMPGMLVNEYEKRGGASIVSSDRNIPASRPSYSVGSSGTNVRQGGDDVLHVATKDKDYQGGHEEKISPYREFMRLKELCNQEDNVDHEADSKTHRNDAKQDISYVSPELLRQQQIHQQQQEQILAQMQMQQQQLMRMQQGGLLPNMQTMTSPSLQMPLLPPHMNHPVAAVPVSREQPANLPVLDISKWMQQIQQQQQVNTNQDMMSTGFLPSTNPHFAATLGPTNNNHAVQSSQNDTSNQSLSNGSQHQQLAQMIEDLKTKKMRDLNDLLMNQRGYT